MRHQQEALQPHVWLDGFEAYYADYVEHKIRLPNKTPKASARAIRLTYAALACTLITAAMWLCGIASHWVGLLAVLSATLVVGALQLRMAGTSLGAQETRNFVVRAMAEYLDYAYDAAPDADRVNGLLEGAGRISPTAVTRGGDWLHGSVKLADGTAQLRSAQVLGGAGPSIDSQSGGYWFGMPIESLWSQFTVDGLLAQVELPHAFPANFTITSDTRLHAAPEDKASLRFAPVATGDEQFDEKFHVLDAWQPSFGPALSEGLREFLLECHERAGPVTLYTQDKTVFLGIWFVGDLYEITSLGVALRHQAHQVAKSMRIPAELAHHL